MEPAGPAAPELAARHNDLTHVVARSIFGVGAGIASAVYGTIVVMATLTAAYANESDPWKLAGIVATTSFVLWVAHVYAHGLSRMITHSRDGVHGVVAEELGVLGAAVAPILALLLGAAGVMRESSAVWVALAAGLVTLAFQGVRYARLEKLGLAGTLAAAGLNIALGLLVVALKVLVTHH
jgi:hypothetical protein